MKRKLSLLSLALVSLFPIAENAFAQSNSELKSEIELLKKQLLLLEKKLDATAASASAATAAAATANATATATANAVDPEDFNRIKIKAEATEDTMAVAGLKGLKINGVIDPTFIYNQRQNHAGFVFLNNFDGAGRSGPNDSYAYDNSYFGQAALDIQKETDSGSKWRLTLAPHKSANSATNVGSIVHEASVSIPLTDPGTRLIAGQFPDWSGYEYYFANVQPLITHNMLFDFTIPSFYSGAGMELTRGPLVSKFLIGNLNQARKPNGDKTPAISYRFDYVASEFLGLGMSGAHSRSPNNKFDLLGFDGTYTRGNLLVQSHLSMGQKKNAAANGGDAQWWGLSVLTGYKLTPRLQALARFDYIDNQKNGGGVFGSTSSGCLDNTGASAATSGNACAVALGDYRNGFGPTYQDAVNYATGASTSLKGANRYALSTGLNYALNPNTTLKLELRYDGASSPVFLNVKDGEYKKGGMTVGTSVAVFF